MLNRLTATLGLLRDLQQAQLAPQALNLSAISFSCLADLLDIHNKKYGRIQCGNNISFIYYTTGTNQHNSNNNNNNIDNFHNFQNISSHAARDELILSLAQDILSNSTPQEANDTHSNSSSNPIIQSETVDPFNKTSKDTSPPQVPSSSTQVFELLRSILSRGSGLPLKPEFKILLRVIAGLITFLIAVQNESQKRLEAYIDSCMELESQFLSQFQTQMSLQLSNHENDTTGILQNLSLLVENVDLKHPNLDFDGVPKEAREFFEAPEIPSSYPMTSQQTSKFFCSNPYFTRLYQAFLHVKVALIRANQTQEQHGKRRYANILIELFKKHLNTEYFEVDDFAIRELKTNYLYDTILHQVLPESLYGEIGNISSTLHFFPEESAANFVDLDPDGLETEVVDNVPIKSPIQSYSQRNMELSSQDQCILIQQLKLILPQLIDYFHFNLEFPRVMKLYLKIVYDNEIHIELEDYDFIQNILQNTNHIVDFENGDVAFEEGIEYSILELYRLHLFLDSEGEDSKTLAMKLALVEYLSWIKLATKYLKRWNYKTFTLIKLQDLENQWKSKKLHKYLACWYSSFMKQNEFNSIASNYYHQRLSESSLITWMEKTQKVLELEGLEYNFNRDKYLRKWQSNLNHVNALELTASKLYTEKVTVKHWDLLNDYYLKMARLNTKSDDFRKLKEANFSKLLLRTIINNWIVKCTILVQPKFISLDSLYKHSVYKKFFNKWSEKHRLEKKLQILKQKLDLSLVKFFFINHWKKSMILNNLSKEFKNKTDQVILLNVFSHWRELLDRYLRAQTMLRHHVMKHYFRVWMLGNKAKQFGTDTRLVETFKVWKLQVKTKKYLDHSNSNLAKEFFNKWTEKKDLLNVMNIKSEYMLCKLPLKSTTNRWRIEYEVQQELNEVADLNFQRKFFNILIQKYRKAQILHKKENQYQEKKWSNGRFSDNITLQFAMELWREARSKKFEMLMESKVIHYQKNYSKLMIYSMYMRKWASKFNEMQQKHLERDELCKEFLNQLSLCVNIFTKWNSVTESKVELAREAVRFNSQMLYKRHLMKWYNYFIHLETYNEMSEEYLSQKDLDIVKGVLNKWSLRSIKARRDEQSCLLFKKRWTSAKARSMFELWLFKAKQKSIEKEAAEIETYNDIDAKDSSYNTNAQVDSSFMTATQSPLAYKLKEFISATRDESYLSTPIKKRGIRPMYTPVTKVSPTKLQETTERLRGERINALIRHYQKARVSSRKQRPSVSYAATTNTPPTRPNFAQFRVPKVDRDQSSSSVFTPGPAYGEDLTIETAKLLRRITPIFVPTEEETMAPRFSPASKLKERAGRKQSPIIETSPGLHGVY